MILLVLAWLVIVNMVTVLAFRIDKDRAGTGARRIREGSLLRLALLGGSPGALFARQRFRHKTRKQPFGSRLIGICLVQLVALAVLGYFSLRPAAERPWAPLIASGSELPGRLFPAP